MLHKRVFTSWGVYNLTCGWQHFTLPHHGSIVGGTGCAITINLLEVVMRELLEAVRSCALLMPEFWLCCS